jgi:aromatic amino acid aminotransferase I / 2-aminoadipate transaminase
MLSDIIIVEDDPYYFLQYPPFVPGASPSALQKQEPDDFLASLVPSFLRFDHQGRVIRLESFSKTMFPGLRLGYFVANALFTERLLRATEVETQDPGGLSQAFVLAVLEKWSADGYIDWLQQLRSEYHARCNWLIDAFAKQFDLVAAADCSELTGAEGVVAVLKSQGTEKRVPIFSFVPPVGGMFIWTKFYLQENSMFQELKAAGISADPEQECAERLWAKLADALVSDPRRTI